MKKLLAGIVAGLAVVIVAGLAWFEFALPRQRPAPQVEIPHDAERVERGRYLVVNVLQCVDCHSERDWTLYGGPPIPPLGAGRECLTRNTQTTGINVGEESFPGTLCIRNITPDVATGLGSWTDGEIMRAVREGVDRDGQGLFPIMPYFIYRHLSDEDMMAVVAYLRTLPPVRAPRRPARQVDFPLNRLIQSGQSPWMVRCRRRTHPMPSPAAPTWRGSRAASSATHPAAPTRWAASRAGNSRAACPSSWARTVSVIQ